MKNVAFTASVEQLATLVLYRRGESDLVHRDGMWFLNATCEVPEAEPNTEPVDFLGIDLGGKRRRKEARRAKDVNHKIAKHVVAEAERTGRGIALEDLTGIRERVRLRKPNGPRRSGVHLPYLRRVRPHRQGEPGLPGLVRVPVLRIR
jgi:IS605 OrfB family transposase